MYNAEQGFSHEGMIPSPKSATTERAIWTTEDGKLLVYGNAVPSDTTAGYAIGCLFFHCDGGDGTALYVNEGTAASCDFNAITVA